MLKRIKYYTMNSWNGMTAPAYNMKVYNIVADSKIRSKIYELMDCDDFWEEINQLVRDFNFEQKSYSAGFNGRSGGYLVLYKNGSCAGFEAKDVPSEVLKAFRRLALDIRATAIYLAKNAKVVDEEVTYTKTVKRMEV
jgi:hypothetical protein